IARVGGATPAPTEPLSRGDWEDLYPRAVDAHSILFESQRSGRLQIWSYDVTSKQVKALAPPGSHSGSVSKDGKTLFYLDPDRGPGVWAVALDGGAPRRISSGAGDDWPPVAYDGPTVVFQRHQPGPDAPLFL